MLSPSHCSLIGIPMKNPFIVSTMYFAKFTAIRLSGLYFGFGGSRKMGYSVIYASISGLYRNVASAACKARNLPSLSSSNISSSSNRYILKSLLLLGGILLLASSIPLYHTEELPLHRPGREPVRPDTLRTVRPSSISTAAVP